jgi:hypothetical protein
VRIGKVERNGVKIRDYSEFLEYSLSKASLSRLEELEIINAEDSSYTEFYKLIVCLVASCPNVKKLSIDFLKITVTEKLLDLPDDLKLIKLGSLRLYNLIGKGCFFYA